MYEGVEKNNKIKILKKDMNLLLVKWLLKNLFFIFFKNIKLWRIALISK